MPILRLVLTIALLAATSVAQDLSGTWLKATVVTKLLPSAPGLDIVGGGPDLASKAAPLTRKVSCYVQILSQLDAESYQVEAFTPFEGGLAPTCVFGTLVLADGGVVTSLDLYVPVPSKKPSGEGPSFGYIDCDFVGQLRVKTDGEGGVKKLSLKSTAGLVDDALIVEQGLVTPHVGAVRLRAKAVDAADLPAVTEAIKITGA